ncbi:MAG TPA: LuxR C-terminal-related transcriptional regulator [Anaerolineaceae bacterium]|nr:LuxR C-terminal-related transcriptional regulator [Anaerolineaceae bacterium]
MPKADPLIRTKLRLPFTRPVLVPRPRLQERLVAGLQGPLTLVIAPAGFGKTTLVASCVVGCGMPVAWLSLDADDNQPGRFLTYLIAALHGADPRLGEEAAQLVAGVQPAPSEAVLTSLVNDLDAAGGELVLVLDDYQFIRSQEVRSAMAFFLEHCPRNLHLLIAARSDPSLPLSRLRARGQMVDLRAADLRFTDSEAAQFLNDVMGLRLDAGSVAVLEERTEGWVAGLQMAALSMRDREDVQGFIRGFSGTNRHILDYLLEEILACQSPEIQRFLLRTSILERLAAPLCDALLEGHPDDNPSSGSPSLRPSASVLETLDRENLFLIALDDERTWFRYHHLFSDLLRARLQQTQPDLIPLLHRRASAWLEPNDLIPEAIQHLCAANEMGRAADLVERYGPARWAEGDLQVMQMADDLPRETLLERPQLCLYHAWLLISQGQIERAVDLLKDLAQILDGRETGSGLGWMRTMIALFFSFLSRSQSIPEDRAIDEIPADLPVLRDAAEILFGMALARRGELERAAQVSAQSIRRKRPSRAGGGPPISPMVPFLARIDLMLGRSRAAASLCRESLDLVRGKDLRFVDNAAMLTGILGEVNYEWNRLEQAEQCVRECLRGNEPWQNILTDAWGLLALTRILLAKGDFAGAMQTVEQFETRLRAQSRPFEFSEDIRTLRVRARLAAGDLAAASQWAEEIRRREDFQRHEEWYRLTLARIRLAQGRYADVEKDLDEKPPEQGGDNRITRHIEYQMTLSAALAGQQRLPETIPLIQSSLALAEPEGNLRAFLDLGEPARELLAAYLRSDAPLHRDFAQNLLAAFAPAGEAGSRVPRPTGLVEPLSAREVEVLLLMALGRTNEEIARKLIVARGTVKAHAASIFRKLDVANRTEAVARARQLGILP